MFRTREMLQNPGMLRDLGSTTREAEPGKHNLENAKPGTRCKAWEIMQHPGNAVKPGKVHNPGKYITRENIQPGKVHHPGNGQTWEKA